MPGRLDGKVALISGGARGQGAAEGKLFATEGAKVVLGDVIDAEGQQTAREIEAAGGTAVYLHLDVTQEADWQGAIDTTVQRFGKLDILVNNAGILRVEGLEDTTLEIWNQVFAVNQTGVFLGMKFAVPAMRAAGGGSIINISSVAGLVGGGGATAYQASKGASADSHQECSDRIRQGEYSVQFHSSRTDHHPDGGRDRSSEGQKMIEQMTPPRPGWQRGRDCQRRPVSGFR